MIQQQLKGILAETGLEEIDAAGKPFDPMLHEAVSQLEPPTCPKARSSSKSAKVTNCATACCGRRRSSSPKNRPRHPLT